VIRAEVISTGTELLAGTPDSNFVEICRMLEPTGVEVRYHSTYGDRMEDLTLGLKTALARAEVVILTGGLGPTEDDLTRRAAAEVFHRPLRFRPEVWRRLRPRLRSARQLQRVQAEFPEGAQVIENRIGTAPGFWIARPRGGFAALSGVPQEMRDMMRRAVLPRLRRIAGPRPGGPPAVLRLFGVPESAAEEYIAPFLRRLGAAHGITARHGNVRITTDRRVARALERHLRRRFGDALYAVEDIELEEVVARELLRRRWTLAVAESCTGGLVADRLTNVPGVSAVLREAVVAYANESKMARLAVRAETLAAYGAVSRETAAQMAAGAALAAGTDAAVATTGVAGPASGTPRAPVGRVFVAAYVRGRTWVEMHDFRGERRQIKERAADAALDLLRRAVAQWP
jgi:nicotinamide-nucleotide amidase